MLFGVLLISLAVLVIFLIFLFRNQILTVSVNPQFVPIIFTDKSELKEVVGLKKEEIAKIVADEVVATKVKMGGVEGLLVLF